MYSRNRFSVIYWLNFMSRIHKLYKINIWNFWEQIFADYTIILSRSENQPRTYVFGWLFVSRRYFLYFFFFFILFSWWWWWWMIPFSYNLVIFTCIAGHSSDLTDLYPSKGCLKEMNSYLTIMLCFVCFLLSYGVQ